MMLSYQYERMKAWPIFYKWNAVALLSSAVDYGTLVTFVEFLQSHYMIGAGTGILISSLISFYLCKYWVFDAIQGRMGVQLFRFGINLLLSAFLNGYGTYFFKEFLHFDSYIISRILTAVLVAVFVNYPMQRIWVFR